MQSSNKEESFTKAFNFEATMTTKRTTQQSDTLKDEFAPQKKIFTQADMKLFEKSKAYHYLVKFIEQLGDAIYKKSLKEEIKCSETILKILNFFDQLDEIVERNPPIKEDSQSLFRYGNPSFRKFFDEMCEKSELFMKSLIKDDDDDQKWKVSELSWYFRESFGNRVRIDYGTGHEVAFVAWMFCLICTGVLGKDDLLPLVGRVFPKYLNFMRKIQKIYKLEPAGSHGVWGLDDYQFLPFYWGASQLIDHPTIQPKSIHDSEIVKSYADEYLYLGCIQFINEVKKGPFGEHSPLLNDISGVPTWTKIRSGLMKMYKVEVLGKYVVIQHFLFGKCLPFEPMTLKK